MAIRKKNITERDSTTLTVKRKVGMGMKDMIPLIMLLRRLRSMVTGMIKELLIPTAVKTVDMVMKRAMNMTTVMSMVMSKFILVRDIGLKR